jgi:membrane-associated phospholipid phosphatase
MAAEGKSVGLIPLNSYHPFLLNVFFINITFMGDGIFAAMALAICLFYFRKKQLGISGLYAFIISGLTVQLIKNLVDCLRPGIFFEAGQYLHFSDGISLANNAGLPSGHTATAFAMATVLALLIKERLWQVFILFIAVLVGYSRIYLAQHFLYDVMTGALIGTAAGVLAVYFTTKRIVYNKFFKRTHQLHQYHLPVSSFLNSVL